MTTVEELNFELAEIQQKIRGLTDGTYPPDYGPRTDVVAISRKLGKRGEDIKRELRAIKTVYNEETIKFTLHPAKSLPEGHGVGYTEVQIVLNDDTRTTLHSVGKEVSFGEPVKLYLQGPERRVLSFFPGRKRVLIRCTTEEYTVASDQVILVWERFLIWDDYDTMFQKLPDRKGGV